MVPLSVSPNTQLHVELSRKGLSRQRIVEYKRKMVKEEDASGSNRARIDSRRVVRWYAFWGCDLHAGTPGTANHRSTSAKRATNIYGRCWCRGHTTFCNLLGKIVIYGDGEESSPSKEGKRQETGGGCGAPLENLEMSDRMWLIAPPENSAHPIAGVIPVL